MSIHTRDIFRKIWQCIFVEMDWEMSENLSLYNDIAAPFEVTYTKHLLWRICMSHFCAGIVSFPNKKLPILCYLCEWINDLLAPLSAKLIPQFEISASISNTKTLAH